MLRKGRFERPMEPLASEYTSSMKDDARLFYPTVQINMAHVIMLAERGIIPAKDASAILRALQDLYRGGITKLDLRPELEDVHMAVEEFVVKETSEETGGKLHTAKSRNDQVSAAIKLALRKSLLDLTTGSSELLRDGPDRSDTFHLHQLAIRSLVEGSLHERRVHP